MSLRESLAAQSPEHVGQNAPQFAAMFDRVGLVEQDVWICHDVLRLKIKRCEIPETGSAQAIAVGVIDGEAESRQHGQDVKPLLYRIPG